MAVGDLAVKLRADTAEFESDMGRAAHVSKREMESMLTSANVAGLAIGAALASVATHYAHLTKEAIDNADALNKMSQKGGVSVEALSALQYSAQLSDVSVGSLAQAMKGLSTNMLEAQSGVGRGNAAFQALGINVEASKGILKPTGQVMLEVADRFAQMEDGAGKTALAVRIFGRAGAELIPLLNQGADGLKKNADEAKRFGIIVSTEAAKAAEEFNDNLTRLGAGSRALGIVLAQETLPWLSKMVERLLEAKSIGGDFLGVLKLLGQQTNIAASPGENLKTLRADLARMENSLPQVLPEFRASADQRIADIKKQIEWEKLLQRQQALALPGGDTPGEAARAAAARGPKLKAPALPGKPESGGRSPRDESERIAREIARGEEEAAKEVAEAWSFVPAMTQRLEELQRLQNAWGDDTFIGMSLEDAREWVKQQYKAIDALAEIEDMTARVAAGFTEDGKAITEATKKADDWGKQLGLTFTSAFEDAVVHGKKLREVLQGIASDVARMILRKTVTEPFANAAQKALEGFSFSKLFGLGGSTGGAAVAESMIGDVWSGSYASGTNYVPRTGLALVHQGEKIIPASQNNGGGNTFYVDMSGAYPESMQDLKRLVLQVSGSIEPRAVSAVAIARSRGALG